MKQGFEIPPMSANAALSRVEYTTLHSDLNTNKWSSRLNGIGWNEAWRILNKRSDESQPNADDSPSEKICEMEMVC